MSGAVALRPDTSAACDFLRHAYEADDWVALFVKAGATGRAVQRIGPVTMFCERRWQTWLHAMQMYGFNVYVSVNAVLPRQRTRRKDAIRSIRHVFLDADGNANGVLSVIGATRDLPPPSYILHSSRNRVHIMWRAARFERDYVEQLQRQLARELSTDPAATPCTQMTRMPGFWNLKYTPPCPVTVEYRDRETRYEPGHFPKPVSTQSDMPRPGRLATSETVAHSQSDVLRQARRYVAVCPPAVSGEHDDLRTFGLCCRLVRGFALNEEDASAVLADWNARCQPPWTEHQLREKLRRARRYGHEPIGGCIRASP